MILTPLVDSIEKTTNIIPDVGSSKIKYEPAVEPSKPKKFRIYAKQFFLTYPHIDLDLDEILNQLITKFNCIDKYVISRENHADGEKHVHIYVSFFKKINITCPRKLDLMDPISNKSYHGDYQAVKNKFDVIRYIKKDGNFISNFETNLEFELNLQKIAIDQGLYKALEYFCLKRPEWVSTRLNTVRNNLKSFLFLKKKKVELKYDNFEYPESIIYWFNYERDIKTLFLTGKSGVGKTSSMVALLKEFNPLLLRNINGLKNLTPEHKAIILDDLDWSTISREVKIHLVDKDYPSDIKILYDCIELSPDLIKVITSNDPHDLLSHLDSDDAIKRRINHVHVDHSMFTQNNIQNNVVINISNTNISNNTISIEKREENYA